MGIVLRLSQSVSAPTYFSKRPPLPFLMIQLFPFVLAIIFQNCDKNSLTQYKPLHTGVEVVIYCRRLLSTLLMYHDT